jgi:hypothetical protein
MVAYRPFQSLSKTRERRSDNGVDIIDLLFYSHMFLGHTPAHGVKKEEEGDI